MNLAAVRRWGQAIRHDSTKCSTVRLLETRASRTPTELLGLAPARVCNNERSIVSHEHIFHLLFGCLVNKLLIISDNSLGNGLADGVDLRRETATLHTNADVHFAPGRLVQEQKGFIYLEAQNIGLDRVDRTSIESHIPAASADKSDSYCRLLAAETLHLLVLLRLLVVSHCWFNTKTKRTA